MMDVCILAWKHHKNFHLLHFKDDCGRNKLYDREYSSRILNGLVPPAGYLPWLAVVSVQHGTSIIKQ